MNHRIPGFCSVANGRRGCNGGGAAGVGVGMEEESGSMMPEEPCDGKRPPRSRGDRPWEKSVSARLKRERSSHYTINLSSAGNASSR